MALKPAAKMHRSEAGTPAPQHGGVPFSAGNFLPRIPKTHRAEHQKRAAQAEAPADSRRSQQRGRKQREDLHQADADVHDGQRCRASVPQFQRVDQQILLLLDRKRREIEQQRQKNHHREQDPCAVQQAKPCQRQAAEQAE